MERLPELGLTLSQCAPVHPVTWMIPLQVSGMVPVSLGWRKLTAAAVPVLLRFPRPTRPVAMGEDVSAYGVKVTNVSGAPLRSAASAPVRVLPEALTRSQYQVLAWMLGKPVAIACTTLPFLTYSTWLVAALRRKA